MKISRAIITGAGRGSRIGAETDDRPKALLEVRGRPLLDYALEAFAAAGINDVVFVGGYRIAAVRARFPHLKFVSNPVWSRTNNLYSLMKSEEFMDRPFIAAHGDLLYTTQMVQRLAAAEGPIAAGVETNWRTRYAGREGHPLAEADKCQIVSGQIRAIGKKLADDAANAEFIGMTAFHAEGAEALRKAYREASAHAPYHEAGSLASASITDMLQRLIDKGTPVRPVVAGGEWLEVDTPWDLEQARAWSSSGSGIR